MNRVYFAPIRTSRLVRRLFILLLLTTGLWWPAAVSAEDPLPGNSSYQVYLPLLVKSGGNAAPAGPYAQLLQQVQQTCAATDLDQLCVATGQVTVQPQAGAATISQPGLITDLAGVQSVSLASSGADPQQWSVAWLRLRAASGTPGQELTVLAVGNVQLSNIALFDSQASLTDTIVLPSLQAESSPVVGAAKAGSSGLIITNPTEEDLLSLMVNGAAITLGSTALVEAQSGQQMTITMATGASLTQSNDNSSSAIQNQQVSVPLNQAGKATGSPTSPVVVDALDYVFWDLVSPLPLPEYGSSALRRLNRAIDRCTAGQARYVYNVLFWTRIIEAEPGLKSHIDPAKLAQAYQRGENCLIFDLDFTSQVTTLSAPLNQNSLLYSPYQSMTVQFLPTGDFSLALVSSDLIYDSYSYTPIVTACPITTSTGSGRLWITDGSLKIAVNQVRVTLEIQVAQQPADQAQLNCPNVPPLTLAQNHWVTAFYHIHEPLRQAPDLHTFRFADWRYRADSTSFADAAYKPTINEGQFTFEGITLLMLFHTPLNTN